MKAGPIWLDRRVSLPGPYLALCLSEAEFDGIMRKLGAKNVPPWISTPQAHATMHTLDHANGMTCVVCMSEWQGRSPVEVAGLLIHEAVHIWQQHCEHIGEREPACEQEAYGIQSIAQELLAEFARRMEQQ